MDRRAVFAIVALALIIAGYFLWPQREPVSVGVHGNKTTANTNSVTNTSGQSQMKVFSTADLPDRDSHFAFTISVPKTWAAEYRSDTKGINFFTTGQTVPPDTLKSSQAFVQYYLSDTFSQEPSQAGDAPQMLTINGYQAEIYTSTGVSQGVLPTWMGQSHTVYVIRGSAAGQTIFLVWSKSPDLDSDQFASIMKTISFTSNE
jgi:hypothetical protein